MVVVILLLYIVVKYLPSSLNLRRDNSADKKLLRIHHWHLRMYSLSTQNNFRRRSSLLVNPLSSKKHFQAASTDTVWFLDLVWLLILVLQLLQNVLRLRQGSVDSSGCFLG